MEGFEQEILIVEFTAERYHNYSHWDVWVRILSTFTIMRKGENSITFPGKPKGKRRERSLKINYTFWIIYKFIYL